MGELFNQMVTVFNKLGNVNPNPIKFKNGKNSKFTGKVSSNLGTSVINLGILHYDWNRSIGVDKINQAIQHTEQAGLDGTLMVANQFSKSAIEQVYRINSSTNKRIFLYETEEIQAAYQLISVS
tara:strand:+ start:247 stop:618 length:372 start_codon:yes stop_codon:yes gene_type:complete